MVSFFFPFFYTSILTSIIPTIIYRTYFISLTSFTSFHSFRYLSHIYILPGCWAGSARDLSNNIGGKIYLKEFDLYIFIQIYFMIDIVHIIFNICGPINGLTTKGVHPCTPYT